MPAAGFLLIQQEIKMENEKIEIPMHDPRAAADTRRLGQAYAGNQLQPPATSGPRRIEAIDDQAGQILNMTGELADRLQQLVEGLDGHRPTGDCEAGVDVDPVGSLQRIERKHSNTLEQLARARSWLQDLEQLV